MIRRGVTPIFLAGALSFVLGAAPAALANKKDDPKWCRACHRQPVYSAEQWKKTVHDDMNCRECHTAYHFNPHEPLKEASSDEIKAVSAIAKKDPAALAACHDCHDELVAGKLLHGDRGAKERVKRRPRGKAAKSPAKPYCADCHGDLHAIREAKKMNPRARRLLFNARCLVCHGDEAKMKRAGFRKDFAHSYADSVHARKLELGSERAPGCVDCHGGHEQTDVKGGMVARCKACHPKANAAFATLVTHKRIKAKPVSYFTQKFFAWLTLITIFLLSLHVLLDLFAALRRGLKDASQSTEG